ncbi:YbjN domain-containing protein [Henriciella aquimarina]|uniref:YbjN domain-containing protein n=1 Tax=Henriciella aquimarina TaxID=545261 RepID=UPI001301D43A|nr:YbjN domain-containing protein [Henriciella aquimarina]
MIRPAALAALLFAIAPAAMADQTNTFPPGSPSPAQTPSAPSGLIDASDPAAIVDLLEEAGFDARLTTQPTGAVQIESSIAETNFWLYFQACTPEFTGCEVITFSSGFDFDSPQVRDILGDWNATHYTKAYLDDSGDPFVEFSVNMVHGVSRENFINTLNWFTTEVKAFMDQIGWNNDTGGTAQPI